MSIRKTFLLVALISTSFVVKAMEKTTGDLYNLVCFVHFSDETNDEAFDKPISYYETLFNASGEGVNSVYQYFYESSYQQLNWRSSFFPSAQGTQIISFRAANPRGYYQHKTSLNPLGYVNDMEKTAREQGLIKELCNYVSNNIDENVQLDGNNDGLVDNICIVISGNSELSSKRLLWPHRSDLILPAEKAVYIKSKKVVGYLVIFNDANGWKSFDPTPLNTGVICHEMSHSLGTYDLYHVNDNLSPIGVWDLMSDNLTTPQQMSVYTKYRYCKWINEIPEITGPGTYTLHPVGGTSKDNIAYKLKPIGSDEYFVFEYRKKEGTFDAGLPASGLLVYRINPNLTGGNVNYNGTTRLDEQYLFRPGGTTTSDGNINQAPFSAESGRTAFGGTAAQRPFYSNGKEAKFAIANVTSCGATISFDVLELTKQIYLPKPEVQLNGAANSSIEMKVEADTPWQITNLPAWLEVTPMQAQEGVTTLTIKAVTENGEAHFRIGQFELVSTTDASIHATAKVSQRSNLIQAPSNVSANLEENSIHLSWIAPFEGTPIVAQDFEDPDNHGGWTINNVNDRGWRWLQATKYYKAYAGNYACRMKEAWIDEHQNEWLISPTFANGKTLSFYSSSTAPQKNNPTNFYKVKVSTDGGSTWETIYDLKTQCTAVNKYVRIDLDLSDYASDQMKVAFHAYDTNNIGLSYWWSIDNVNIYPTLDNSMVTGYAIYRNGVKIGTSSTTSFVDQTPETGDNEYTIRALGSFGDTPDSAPVTINYEGSGINTVDAASQLQCHVTDHTLVLTANENIKQVALYSLTGVLLQTVAPNNTTCTLPVNELSEGVYLVRASLENSVKAVYQKVMIR
jgi:M6 family metalloprotease-like protein